MRKTKTQQVSQNARLVEDKETGEWIVQRIERLSTGAISNYYDVKVFPKDQNDPASEFYDDLVEQLRADPAVVLARITACHLTPSQTKIICEIASQGRLAEGWVDRRTISTLREKGLIYQIDEVDGVDFYTLSEAGEHVFDAID